MKEIPPYVPDPSLRNADALLRFELCGNGHSVTMPYGHVLQIAEEALRNEMRGCLNGAGFAEEEIEAATRFRLGLVKVGLLLAQQGEDLDVVGFPFRCVSDGRNLGQGDVESVRDDEALSVRSA